MAKTTTTPKAKAGFNIWATLVRNAVEYYYTWNAKNGQVYTASETHKRLAYTRRVVNKLSAELKPDSPLRAITDHTLTLPIEFVHKTKKS